MSDALWESMRNGALILACVQLVFSLLAGFGTIRDTLSSRWTTSSEQVGVIIAVITLHAFAFVKNALLGALLGFLWYVIFGR